MGGPGLFHREDDMGDASQEFPQKTPMWIPSKFVVLPPSSYDHLQNGMSTESRLTVFDLNQWISTKVRKLGSSFSLWAAKNGLA